ncbi:glycine-rich cell wall structural protein 1.0 [Brassica rapa]|uniref:glycine-rich cell wall structural protein 1.0 n=1 Tax=Brassica campestris TaxID=3711 RepID=UPI00142D7126|nr:glycine-rich cell wall structural protein 1.0 [Brassica rapa]
MMILGGRLRRGASTNSHRQSIFGQVLRGGGCDGGGFGERDGRGSGGGENGCGGGGGGHGGGGGRGILGGAIIDGGAGMRGEVGERLWTTWVLARRRMLSASKRATIFNEQCRAILFLDDHKRLKG